jgi:hypothetical protein
VWHALVDGAVEHVLHLDTPLLRTIVGLTRRPGSTVREYLQGVRRRYIDPVRYVLIVATLLLIAWHLVDHGSPVDTPPQAQSQIQVFRTIMRFMGITYSWSCCP